MTIRKIIRDFVAWQIENEMLNELTIDYEVAETYLEEKKIKLCDLHIVVERSEQVADECTCKTKERWFDGYCGNCGCNVPAT